MPRAADRLDDRRRVGAAPASRRGPERLEASGKHLRIAAMATRSAPGL